MKLHLLLPRGVLEFTFVFVFIDSAEQQEIFVLQLAIRAMPSTS